MQRTVTLGLTFLASVLVGAQQPATPPVPDFRSGIETVRIDLRAVDASGQFIDDLTAADVRVFEDGREQAVTSFARVSIPPPDVTRPIPPDNVSSNAGLGEGRQYVLLIDDMNLHPFRAPTVRAIAHQFVDRHLGAGDLVAIATTSGNSAISHEFTGNRSRLKAAIDRLADSSIHGANEEIVMRSLRQVVEWFGASLATKKSLVFISEGVPYDLEDPFANGTGTGGFEILDEMRVLVAAAARSNVNIFTISPVGQPTAPPIGSITPLRVVNGENQADEVWRLSRESLETFADETGGFALVMSNAFDAALERIVDESSRYYAVAFTPDVARADGRFRRVDVRVSRPGVTVRSRPGYVARPSQVPKRARPPKQLPLALGETLQHPLPIATLPLTVTTTLAGASGKRARVGVMIETAPHERPYDVFVAASGGDGKVKDSRRLQVDGTRTDLTLNLAKGRYHLRVVAVEAGGRRGSVFHDFDVPNTKTLAAREQ